MPRPFSRHGLAMNQTTDINPLIIEGLYTEALLLADEVRAAFDMSGRLDALAGDEDLSRIALSCEALRTTTRMMHAIAWLLNQKAYLNGELSDFQLRRSGRLPRSSGESDPQQMALIHPEIRGLIENTERFYARISRLDMAWRENFSVMPGALQRLRDRLGASVETRVSRH